MRTILIIAAATVAMSGAAFAGPHLNSAGKCIGDNGKFVAASMCAKPVAAQKCRNAKGQYAKCGTPGAKPTAK